MFKGFILGVIVTIVVALAVAYVVLSTGLIPANADATPGGLERWAASTSLRATLRAEAPKTANPVPLTDASLLEGVNLYGGHCAGCHGGAGGGPPASPIAKGQYPRPPQLGSGRIVRSPEGVTFWVVKHGIRWTGMPSWKSALNDQQIWTIALFLKHMDKLPPTAEAAWKQVGVRKPAPPTQPAPQPVAPASPPPQ